MRGVITHGTARGDLALAVLVERGGVGDAVAAPIAARFLQAYNSD